MRLKPDNLTDSGMICFLGRSGELNLRAAFRHRASKTGILKDLRD